MTSIRSSQTGFAKGGYDTSTQNTVAYTPATGGSLGSFTEQNFRNLITGIAGQQDMIAVSQIIMSLKNRERASRKLTGLAGFRKDYGKARGAMTAVGTVELYASDFGLHRLMFNRWQPVNVIYFIDPRYWALRYLQSFEILPIARTGHAVKRMIKVEFGLESMSEAASGALVDATDGGA